MRTYARYWQSRCSKSEYLIYKLMTPQASIYATRDPPCPHIYIIIHGTYQISSRYRLTFSLTKDKQFTTFSTLFYALQPAPAVSSSPYTEPLFAFLTFSGYYLLLPNLSATTVADNEGISTRSSANTLWAAGKRRLGRWIRRGVGVACLALAVGTRSLGILAVLVIGWPVLERLWWLRFRGIKVNCI